MNPTEQARFEPLYEQMQQDLVLQGMRPKTIEAYSRAVRRVAKYFHRCPDDLKEHELAYTDEAGHRFRAKADTSGHGLSLGPG